MIERRNLFFVRFGNFLKGQFYQELRYVLIEGVDFILGFGKLLLAFHISRNKHIHSALVVCKSQIAHRYDFFANLPHGNRGSFQKALVKNFKRRLLNAFRLLFGHNKAGELYKPLDKRKQQQRGYQIEKHMEYCNLPFGIGYDFIEEYRNIFARERHGKQKYYTARNVE